MIKTVAFAAAIAAALSPVAAVAQQAWQVGNDSMHLYNRDLDMNSVAGRATLLARVEQAAARLCRDSGDRRDCARQAVDATLAGPAGGALRVAMTERRGVQVAGR